ncbi:NADP-dependent oxidoreductase [Salicibibacter kimchii]|uniref:NADP-dependent oxidoreductase n=1 Tax=Salicibibacter kimchii TaxID=2099786 RepID=A0A345C1S6_9BACI|nr:NADP-dependent oxidoreductase [Salicibibacter kimchii]AXF57157.1 NADP-dependent oxidoreductase [Salicibibacter kimchii]
MKGIGINEYGDHRALTVVDLPDREVGANEVRISLRASGVNPIDWKLREGYLKEGLPFDPPLVLGWDGAGVIKEVGKSVDTFQVGDAVFFRPELTEYGTYAEEIIVEEALVQPKHKDLSFVEAASLPLVGLTVIEALMEIAALTSGQRLLLLGGSGGVGTIAVQIAKALGAHVTTTVSEKNREFAKARGADTVIAYDINEKPEGEFDVLFDTVGGSAYAGAIPFLKTGASAVSIAGGASQNDDVSNNEEKKQIKTNNMFMQPTKKKMAQLRTFVDQKQVSPVISHTHPMTVDGAKQAHLDSETIRTRGKIVLERENEEEIK